MTNTETDRLYASISAAASGFKVAMTPEEVAELAVRNDFGDDELRAVESVFAYLAKTQHDKTIEVTYNFLRTLTAE